MSATSDPTTLTSAQVSQVINIGNLQDRVALITGASSGIGRAIAQAYAAAGAYVVNADLTPNPPAAPLLAAQENMKNVDLTTPTVDLVNSQFPSTDPSRPRAIYIECNVTEPSSVEAAVAFTVQHHNRLDIMVNNAGIASESGQNADSRIHQQDVSFLDKNYAVNVRGVWLGCKYAIAQMMKRDRHQPSGDRGWVINICSIASTIAIRGSSAYCASKGAVLQITRTVAVDYAADRIHVNCINPGFVDTSFLERVRETSPPDILDQFSSLHPWGRLALPQDVAKMAVFLAGDGASFCTGQPFVVDGGYTAQ